MAAKNSIKEYAENSYYHIYNRGVEKRTIFLDDQDLGVFLSYLKEYLLPKDEKSLSQKLSDPAISYKEKDKIIKALRLNNFSDEITLCAYCLMPNHFHLLVKQKTKGGIDKFMRSLGTRYAMYFNMKYKRVGQLYQDVYKAVLVESGEQLLHLSRYIHRNPLSLASQGECLQSYLSQPSSYPEYLGQRKSDWVSTSEVLPYFSKTNPQLSYQSFVEQMDDFPQVSPLAIDI